MRAVSANPVLSIAITITICAQTERIARSKISAASLLACSISSDPFTGQLDAGAPTFIKVKGGA
jgi:hypothetical protein